MKAGGNGHYPAQNMSSYTFKKEKGADGEIHEVPVPTPNLSNDLKEAIQRIAKAEMYDKTWILLIIVTVCWSTRQSDDEVKRNPLRIIVPATVGMILINIKSLVAQKNIWVNEVRLFVCIVLVCVLTNYMYSICNQHLENITEIEKIQNAGKSEDDGLDK